MTWDIAAFYQFSPLPDYQSRQQPLLAELKTWGAKGSLLLAEEGVNGTVAAPQGNLPQVLQALRNGTGLTLSEIKYSQADEQPFKRMKVRLKKEIVTLGPVPADPARVVGTYVEPQDWNALISDPDVLVIDTRNDYEVAIGSFTGAIDPHTESFSAFPAFVENTLKDKSRKVAMFCTGGIRCEKATSYMKLAGFENVFHLKGGILKYLETVPQEKSLWQGGCFVFDERVSVGHGLRETGHSMCHGCLHPVSAEDRTSPHYEEGVACPRCAADLSDTQRQSNRERQKQFVLSQKRGTRHLGPVEG